MKNTLYILTLITVAILAGLGGWALKSNGVVPIGNGTVVAIPDTTPSDREMERELIRYDIKESGDRIGLSPRQQQEYLVFLESAAEKYDLPMILVHTVAYVESSYDPSAIHPQILVKGKPTRAVGLTGIVWEYNYSYLVKEGIAVSRLELTEPKINLLAGAAILRADINEILAKNPQVSVDKFFDELIRKYYGAYDETYKVRMLTKIKDIASKQWIRRTVKTIIINHEASKTIPIVTDTVAVAKVSFSK